MPLIKSSSKKAVSENIRRERNAGKPQAQAIAIAMSVARRARKKKYAEGGEVEVPLWLESGMIDAPPPSLATAPKQSAEWRAQRMRRIGPADPMDVGTAVSMATAPFGGAAMGIGTRAVTAAFPKIAAAAPRLAATVGGAGGLAGLSGLPAVADETIKKLQTQLRDAGFYSGPIDGVMGRGTQRAKEAFDKAEAERVARDAQAVRDRTASMEAEARAAEIRERRESREALQKQQSAGQKRFAEMESDVPWYRRAVRDYGSAAGYLVGGILGAGVRHGVVKASDILSGRRIGRAESMMAQDMTDVPGRVARVNEFWRQGGANAAVPFISRPKSETGFAINPEASPIDRLYRPNWKARAAVDAGVPAVGVGETLAAEHFLAGPAREELRAANEAAAKDPSEINLRRLQTAKDNVAIGEASVAMGRGTAIGYPAMAMHSRRASALPNMQPAEAERLRLEQFLREGRRGRASSSPPLTATQPATEATTASTLTDSLGRAIYKRPDGKWAYGNHRLVSQDELKALRSRYPDMASGGRVPRPRPWEGGGFAPEADVPPWVAGFPREEIRRLAPIPLPRPRPQLEEDIPLPRARPPDMTIDMEPEAFPGPIEESPSSQPVSQPELARPPLPLGGTRESRSAPGIDIDPIISSIPQLRVLRTLRRFPPPYQPAPRAGAGAPPLRFESMNPMRGQPRGPDGRFRKRGYEFDGMAAGGSIGGREWTGGLMSQQTPHDRLKSHEENMEARQLAPGGSNEDSNHYYWQNPSEDTNPYTAHRREQRLALGGSPRIPSVPSAGKAQFESFTGGLINSSVPGRTDKINMKVPAGSYVVPSSVVSHLGQDNTMAGSGVLDSMFKPASSRNTGQSARIRSGRPYRIRRKKADGGPVDDVPIIAAGGEWVATPDMLINKFGDLDRAHSIMDAFVKQVRKQHIQTLKSLPGPEK